MISLDLIIEKSSQAYLNEMVLPEFFIDRFNLSFSFFSCDEELLIFLKELSQFRDELGYILIAFKHDNQLDLGENYWILNWNHVKKVLEKDSYEKEFYKIFYDNLIYRTLVGSLVQNSIFKEITNLVLAYNKRSSEELKAIITGCALPEMELMINNKKYKVISSIYNQKPIAANDYVQLEHEQIKYLLKDDRSVFKNSNLQFPYIFGLNLSTEVAALLGLKIQKCEIIQINNHNYALIEDVRSKDDVKCMEPLRFYSGKVNLYELNYQKFYDALREITKHDPREFLVTVGLFDIFIGNNQRDSSSLRILKDHNGDMIFDYLIDHNLGSFYFDTNSIFSRNQEDSLLQFILKYGQHCLARKVLNQLINLTVKDLFDHNSLYNEKFIVLASEILNTGKERLKKLFESIYDC